jgi:hypothetical protein
VIAWGIGDLARISVNGGKATMTALLLARHSDQSWDVNLYLAAGQRMAVIDEADLIPLGDDDPAFDDVQPDPAGLTRSSGDRREHH